MRKRIVDFLTEYTHVFRGFGFFGLYVISIHFAKLVVVTLLTYFALPVFAPSAIHRSADLFKSDSLHSEFSAGPSQLDDLSESLHSNKYLITVLATALFLLAYQLMSPIFGRINENFFSLYRLRQNFLPGFRLGLFFAALCLATLIGTGFWSISGFSSSLDDLPIALISLGFKTLTVLGFSFSEELVFRKRILDWVRMDTTNLNGILITALLYTTYKSSMDGGFSIATLVHFFFGLFFGLVTLIRSDFFFASGIVFSFHFFTQLLFGPNAFVIVKFAPPNPEAPTFFSAEWLRFLSGGDHAPFASFTLLLVLVALSVRLTLKNKNILFRR